MKYNFRLPLSLLLILIVCWIGYDKTEEINKISNSSKPLIQQIQRFLWLISVGVISLIAFYKSKYEWVFKILLLVYFIGIILIGLFGLIQYKWQFFSENQKELISGTRLFLSSPLPLIICWLLTITETKSKN